MRRKLAFFTLSVCLAALALAQRAEALGCKEGSTRAIRTGSCCTFDRELNEIYVCQDGLFWVPTGEYTCNGLCVEF